MKRLMMVVAGLMLIMPCAHANDSTARVGAGGLELLKTDNIQMVSEVLEISTEKIRVTYHFLNTSDKDIKTTVAFPMPGVINGPTGDSGENNKPLDSFQVFVAGASVTVNKNRVFLVGNVDVTDKLRKIGLSEEQIFDSKFSCTSSGYSYKGCNVTEEQIAQLKELGTDGDSEGSEIKETAYWEQTFPAGKEIEVVHEYKPFIGRSQMVGKLSRILKGYDGKEDIKEACSRETFKSMKAYSNFSKFYHGSLEQVEYILGTGRNWKGPIKKFKLIIKKDTPEEIVSLCFPGKFLKISPTTLEFSRSNFVPKDNLIIYFYYLAEQVPE